jgi:malate/lactate dehydrogenase
VKVGVIGVGTVGAATVLSLIERGGVCREIVVVDRTPERAIGVVTDPPDPLADLTRRLAGYDRVFLTGTLIDSLRFRVHLADRLRVRPRDVQAMVVGEHGTSEVLLWSSASVSGIPVLELLGQNGESVERLKQQIEHDIRYANITIIERAALERSATALRQAAGRVLGTGQ